MIEESGHEGGDTVGGEFLPRVDRQEFLRLAGTGLGALGVASLFGAPAFAGGQKGASHIVAITHGGTVPNRAVLGLLTAGKLLENGAGKVHVWLVLEGAELANRNKAARIESPIFKKFGKEKLTGPPIGAPVKTGEVTVSESLTR